MTEKNKAQHIADYIQSIAAIEEGMQPYRDQRKGLASRIISKTNGLIGMRFPVAMKAFRLFGTEG